ncbi:MAG: nucleotidyl transferase, partial [Candidatus Hydrogenedentes bacterium]|nr:nucleotidyl transferase [Candidatus Hydrogenedentota bacterium]
MQIRKAVITAAARGARLYPAADTVQKGMLPLVDRDGLTKPVIQIIAEEAIESGIEEIVVVCAPGDDAHYRRHFHSLRENLLDAYRGAEWARLQAEKIADLERRIRFAVQDEPLGYGHAVYCARAYVGDGPFLLLLGDHLYVSQIEGKRCVQQLIDLAQREDCAVAAVQATREHLVGRYGTLTGRRQQGLPGVYQIDRIIEKPSLSQAELELHTPGLRIGHYLCFFGMYVLTPALFAVLDEALHATADKHDVALTPALQELAHRERFLALELKGTRYDIGAKFGLLQ